MIERILDKGGRKHLLDGCPELVLLGTLPCVIRNQVTQAAEDALVQLGFEI